MTLFFRRLGLSFSDPHMEADFLDQYRLRHLLTGQAAIIVGGVSFYLFFIPDRMMDPVHWVKAEIIRCALVGPLLFACAASLHFPKVKKHQEWVAALAMTIASIGLSAVYHTITSGFDYATVGIVLIILVCITFFPIRLPFFIGSTAPSLAIFFIAELASIARPGMLVVNGLVLASATALGSASVVWREHTARSEFAAARALERSRARVNDLLLSMLPADIVRRIESGETVIADAHKDVSVVFADLVGFTDLSRRVSARQLVEILNDVFSRFDEQAGRRGLERIKTMGDVYMAVGGLSDRGPASRASGPDHAHEAAEFALAAQAIVMDLAVRIGHPVDLRVGLHVGPVVAGVIGARRPAFDCWGDAVNLASRLETSARPGSILVSEAASRKLRDAFSIRVVNDVDLKGIGLTKAFLLERAN